MISRKLLSENRFIWDNGNKNVGLCVMYYRSEEKAKVGELASWGSSMYHRLSQHSSSFALLSPYSFSRTCIGGVDTGGKMEFRLFN